MTIKTGLFILGLTAAWTLSMPSAQAATFYTGSPDYRNPDEGLAKGTHYAEPLTTVAAPSRPLAANERTEKQTIFSRVVMSNGDGWNLKGNNIKTFGDGKYGLLAASHNGRFVLWVLDMDPTTGSPTGNYSEAPSNLTTYTDPATGATMMIRADTTPAISGNGRRMVYLAQVNGQEAIVTLEADPDTASSHPGETPNPTVPTTSQSGDQELSKFRIINITYRKDIVLPELAQVYTRLANGEWHFHYNAELSPQGDKLYFGATYGHGGHGDDVFAMPWNDQTKMFDTGKTSIYQSHDGFIPGLGGQLQDSNWKPRDTIRLSPNGSHLAVRVNLLKVRKELYSLLTATPNLASNNFRDASYLSGSIILPRGYEMYKYHDSPQIENVPGNEGVWRYRAVIENDAGDEAIIVFEAPKTQ